MIYEIKYLDVVEKTIQEEILVVMAEADHDKPRSTPADLRINQKEDWLDQYWTITELHYPDQQLSTLNQMISHKDEVVK